VTPPMDQTWCGGTLLLPSGTAEGQLVVRRGKIVEIAAADRPIPRSKVESEVPGFLVLPGLINAHDHLEFNCFPPCAPGRPYENATAWYADVRAGAYAETLRAVQTLPLRDRLLAGAFKNLLSGATTVAHHNPPVRALLGRRFPVTVPRNIGYCHSLATNAAPRETLPGKDTAPWVIHAAEGTDQAARAEVSRLHRMGCLRPGSVLVHCLGIDHAADPATLAATGTAVVWCPGSNDHLYDAVAPVSLLRRHTTVALGTDSTLSGGGGMLDELRAARRTVPGLDHAGILEMATSAGAALFHLPAKGVLAPGADADLIFFRLPSAAGANPLEAPFEAHWPSLVVRRGVPLVGETAFRPMMEEMGLAPVLFRIGETERVMPRHLFQLFARTVKATRGWPPFGETVCFY